MKNSLHLKLSLALLLLLAACSNEHAYIAGLKKAQNPVPDMVSNQLTPISSDNKDLQWTTINGTKYVLAVSWKADTTYYTKTKDNTTGYYTYNTGNYPIFITAAPYLKNMNLGDMSDDKLTLRLDQLLGLPPTAKYSYFLEIWVKPEDLFRPCFDPATNTNACEFAPSKNDAANTDYMCWLYQYIYGSFSATDEMQRYPFTHLGYTYDWSPKNKSHVGLSEYVIGTNKNIYIRKIYTTKGYFNN